MKKWINKQLWRVTQTYRLLAPFIDITKIVLWGIITIGITQWFVVSFEMAVVIVLIAFCSLLLFGYVFDKTGFFREAGSRAFKILNTDLYMHQVNLSATTAALRLAQCMALDTTALESIIEDEKRWFETLGVEE